MYRNSLQRRFYCVQDKVDVSGTTFTACFTVLYASLFITNLLSSSPYLSPVAFWVQGLFYYVYLLYALASYRDPRELCFYCKFEMVQGGLHCLLGFCMTEMWQWAFLVTVGVIFGCVVIVRQAQKEDREEEQLRRLERAQYELERAKRSEGDSDEAQASAAYLAPKKTAEK